MTALYIILGIIVILLLIAHMRVGVRAEYSSEGFILDLRSGHLNFRLIPKNDKGKKEKKNKSKKATDTKEKTGGSFEKIKEILPGILEALGTLRRKIRIDKLKIYYMAANEDPYKAAMSFGNISAGLGFLTTFIENVFDVKKRDFRTAVSFYDEKPTVYILALTTIRVRSALHIALKFLIFYFKLNNTANEGKVER